MNIDINVRVSIKFFNDTKSFGFFRQAGKGLPDVFVNLTLLEQFGFTKADMVMDKPAMIDFFLTPKGLVATRIYSIGDKKTPPTERRSIVDRHKDLVIVKVTEIATNRSLFEVRKDSISGEQVGDDLFCLAEARQAIGKSINHPISESHGRKTNVIRITATKPKKEDGASGKQKKAA